MLIYSYLGMQIYVCLYTYIVLCSFISENDKRIKAQFKDIKVRLKEDQYEYNIDLFYVNNETYDNVRS